MGIGASKAKVYDQDRPTTRFEDVAGYEGAKREISEVVDFLKNPGRYAAAGAVAPRGVLMVGPPGTGKTLLARAVAGEADGPVLRPDRFELRGDVRRGRRGARARPLHRPRARPRPRSSSSTRSTRSVSAAAAHWCRTTNASRRSTSCSRRWTASTRRRVSSSSRRRTAPRRSTRPCCVRGVSTGRSRSRCRTCSNARRSWPSTPRQEPRPRRRLRRRRALARPGFSGADLANLLNEAAIVAVRDDRNTISAADFSEARDRILLGRREATNALMPGEKHAVAVHESGHALVAALSPNADPVAKVTILPAGQALGVTEQLPVGRAAPLQRELPEGLARGAPRRARGRAARARRGLVGRVERPARGDRPRDADGARVRHEQAARAGRLLGRRPDVPRHRAGAQPRLRGGDPAGDRRGGLRPLEGSGEDARCRSSASTATRSIAWSRC